MWKFERCARAAGKRLGGTAFVAILALALALLAPLASADPAPVFIQSEHPAAVLPALDPVGQALKRLIDDANWQPGTFKLNWARLRSLYLTRAYHRAWSNPQDEARARVALGQADREGLSPGDYAIEAILPPDNDDPERLAKYDLLLSNALLNYASDVRLGRVVAGAGESDVDLPVQHYDAVSDLQGALSGGSIAA